MCVCGCVGACLSLTHIHAFARALSLSHSLSPTLSLSRTIYHTDSLTHIHSHSLVISLTHLQTPVLRMFGVVRFLLALAAGLGTALVPIEATLGEVYRGCLLAPPVSPTAPATRTFIVAEQARVCVCVCLFVFVCVVYL